MLMTSISRLLAFMFLIWYYSHFSAAVLNAIWPNPILPVIEMHEDLHGGGNSAFLYGSELSEWYDLFLIHLQLL